MSLQVAAFAPVPSLGGAAALVFVGCVLALSAVAGWSLLQPERDVVAIIQATAVGLLVLVGLTRLPSELSTRHAQWSSQRGHDAVSGEREVQRSFGVDPEFADFADRALPPGATFVVFVGPDVTSSAPQSWLQWSLLPRVAEYQRPCRAQWIVLFSLAEPPEPIELSTRTVFAPGYSVGRNEAPCAS